MGNPHLPWHHQAAIAASTAAHLRHKTWRWENRCSMLQLRVGLQGDWTSIACTWHIPHWLRWIFIMLNMIWLVFSPPMQKYLVRLCQVARSHARRRRTQGWAPRTSTRFTKIFEVWDRFSSFTRGMVSPSFTCFHLDVDYMLIVYVDYMLIYADNCWYMLIVSSF